MKNPQAEICWSEEDLAYLAWLPGRPDCRAFGETPEQARLRLERLLSARVPAGEEQGGESSAPASMVSDKDRPAARKVERLGRLEAASRQLDAAVRLFLAGDEPLAVHALVTAAGEVFADRLVRWGGREAGDCLPRQDYLRRLRAARALLRSPGGEESLELDMAGNDALIAQALADRLAACPFLPLSRDMALFREWYRAARDGQALAEAPATEPARPRRTRPLPARALQFSLLPDV